MAARVIAVLAAATAVAGDNVVTADQYNMKSFGVGRSQFRLTPGGQPFTLLTYNVSSAATHAVITHWWITGEPISSGTSTSIADYTVFSFYVDGEATASISLQMSQAALVGNADNKAPWGNDFAAKYSAFGGWHVDMKIPFQSSIVVTLSLPAWLPTSGSRMAYAMVRGVENMPVTVGGYTLPTTARLVASVRNSSLDVLDFHDLITIPAGTPGCMVATMIDMTLYGNNAGNTNSLEGCWHAYEPPTAAWPGWLLGTGSEDYPESAYYFNAGPYRGSTSGLTVWDISSNLSRISFYKLHHRDPIFFRDGFRFQWRNGDVSDTTTGLKCTSITGNVIGSPTRANVTTLAYAYTW